MQTQGCRNNSFSGQSENMTATDILQLKEQGSNSSGETTLSLGSFSKDRSGNCPLWECEVENTMCRTVSNFTHSGVHQQPFLHPFPHPHHTLPCLKWTLLLCSAWAAVVQSHTELLFDFTSVLRRLRQARPGISAMWLKNGNRSQEYKRRHTGCGSGSVVDEWVVD